MAQGPVLRQGSGRLLRPAWVVGLGWLMGCGLAWGGEPWTEVKANEGTLRIQAQIEAPGTREQVWRLLTDFERLAEFMPNVDSSRVVSRTDSSVLVREVVTSQLVRPWTFAFTLEYIPLEPSELRFRQVAGQLRGYEGVWLLEPRGERTAVSYQARVGYRRVPGFLAAYIVRRQLSRMMPALAAEMQRRTGGG